MVIPQLPPELLEQLGVERGPAHGRRHQQANTGCSLKERLNWCLEFPAKGERVALRLRD